MLGAIPTRLAAHAARHPPLCKGREKKLIDDKGNDCFKELNLG